MRWSARWAAVMALAAGTAGLAVPVPIAGATPPSAASRSVNGQHHPARIPAKPFDLNGDGYPDLVVGAPGDQSNHDAAVHVEYVGPHGLTHHGVILRGGGSGYVGATIASGDFNRDGYADLAVGAPGSGDVYVYYGRPPHTHTMWTEGDDFGPYWSSSDSTGPTTGSYRYETGLSLAVGDFNHDGYADLAYGSPLIDVSRQLGTSSSTGVVLVRYGSPSGLNHGNDLVPGGFEEWDAQNTAHPTSNDRGGFGTALAVMQLPGDNIDDLVVGWPGRDAGGVEGDGAVVVIPGTTQGLDGAAGQLLDLTSPHVAGQPEKRTYYEEEEGSWPAGEAFGSALASGDFNGDGHGDLAIGIPARQVVPSSPDGSNPTSDAHGAVDVLYAGSATFPTHSTWIDLAGRGVPGNARRVYNFGISLLAADVTGDASDDLVAGAPANRPFVQGGVLVAPGSRAGVRPARGRWLTERSCHVPGRPMPDDFGLSLATLRMGRHLHLLVGASEHIIRHAYGAGIVAAVPRVRHRLRPTATWFIRASDRGLHGSDSAGDLFGHLSSTAVLGDDYRTNPPYYPNG
ncbi:MAG: FG-GAP repeat protein [Frankiales bacterium]|nr:FG-GAP repeat protein [Frankiales bacterium]